MIFHFCKSQIQEFKTKVTLIHFSNALVCESLKLTIHCFCSKQELLQHPLFIKELDYSKPLPPLMQGLQAMMYESEDLDGRSQLVIKY